jgi:hypothetical protein
MAKAKPAEVTVLDRIVITHVGDKGADWGLYEGAAGIVSEVRPQALIVAWDDPILNEHEVPLCMGMGDRWAVVTDQPARGRRWRRSGRRADHDNVFATSTEQPTLDLGSAS